MDKKNQGTTLIELILYISLVSFFLVISGYFSLDIIMGRAKAYAQQEVNGNLRVVEKQLSTSLRSAITILGETDFDTDLAAVPGSHVALQQLDSATNPTIFEVQAGILKVKKGSSDFQALTSKSVEVTHFLISNFSSPDQSTQHIHYDFTVSFYNPSGDHNFAASKTIEGSIELRNKNTTPFAATYTPTVVGTLPTDTPSPTFTTTLTPLWSATSTLTATPTFTHTASPTPTNTTRAQILITYHDPNSSRSALYSYLVAQGYSVTVSSGVPTLDILNTYDVVMYTQGLGSNKLLAVDRTNLKNYVSTGKGRLFIEGEDVLQDALKAGDTTFISSVLHTSSTGNDAGKITTLTVANVSHPLTQGLSPSTSTTYSSKKQDYLVPDAWSLSVLDSNFQAGSGDALLVYDNNLTGQDRKRTVFFPASWYVDNNNFITNQTFREKLISNIVQFLHTTS